MTQRLHDHQRFAIRERVREHAAHRNGIFRRSDLSELGIDPAIARSFVRRGWWKRLHHGVYVDSDVLAAASDAEARVRIFASAALSAIAGPAYASGPTGSLLHGQVVDRQLVDTIHLMRPLDTDQRALHRRITSESDLSDVLVHRHDLSPRHITSVDGIPVVDRFTAAITTAAMSELMWAVATLDSLVWQDPEALAELSTRLESWSGLRGIGVVRRAVSLARCGAQTALESTSRFRLMEAGLPEPELQVPFYDSAGLIGYADMVWPHLRVIGEADGLGKYRTGTDLIAEKVREDRLRALGWIVVRWTWEEIFRDPRAVARRILKAASTAQAAARYPA